MAFAAHADYLIAGTGIHGLSTAWRPVDQLAELGGQVQGRMAAPDKSAIASGALDGIGCFTADSFPVFGHLHGNVMLITDGGLGEKQDLPAPIRSDQLAKGNLHPASNSPHSGS